VNVLLFDVGMRYSGPLLQYWNNRLQSVRSAGTVLSKCHRVLLTFVCFSVRSDVFVVVTVDWCGVSE